LSGRSPGQLRGQFHATARVNDADLAPLIDFMRFIDQADHTTFESELPNHPDADSFATCPALNALLVNKDSMIGMKNNYCLYLYYDLTLRRTSRRLVLSLPKGSRKSNRLAVQLSHGATTPSGRCVTSLTAIKADNLSC
jgi:hypothetical protein